MVFSENEPRIRNAALIDLAPLIGTWGVTVSDAEFLDGDQSLRGTMTVEWLDGAALVVMRTVVAGGPPASTQVVGRNEARPGYEVLYADDRGTSRVYAMTLVGASWTMHREDPGFHQHLDATIDPTGNRIAGTWSRSHDEGVTWVHDFAVTYARTT